MGSDLSNLDVLSQRALSDVAAVCSTVTAGLWSLTGSFSLRRSSVALAASATDQSRKFGKILSAAAAVRENRPFRARSGPFRISGRSQSAGGVTVVGRPGE